MSRHVLTRGTLVAVGPAPIAPLVRLTIDSLTDPDICDDFDVDRETAQAIFADELLFADVEVCLTRAGETTPADGERARYLAASADVARLERALADTERTVRDLRASAAARPAADDAGTLRAQLAALAERATQAEALIAQSDEEHRGIRATSVALAAAVEREIAHARFVAAYSDSDAIRGAMGHVAERLRGLLEHLQRRAGVVTTGDA